VGKQWQESIHEGNAKAARIAHSRLLEPHCNPLYKGCEVGFLPEKIAYRGFETHRPEKSISKNRPGSVASIGCHRRCRQILDDKKYNEI
jgi:hypothetical protein